MQKFSETGMSSYSDDSFKALFWQQQLKAASLNKASGMRWHPLVIKWCIYLQYKSSSTYEALRSTGVIKLPSGHTLRDYKHFASPVTSFSDEYKQLLGLTKKSVVLSKHVGIMIDEMYVKGLVFDKHTGAITGFLDLGDVTTHLTMNVSHKKIQRFFLRSS